MDPISTSALTAFVTASATKGMNAPMQTLDDVWYLVFGDLSQFANKKKVQHEINLAKFKDSILQQSLTINPDNLQEPSMSIVGPALEASKYYIEEEKLRNMFAKVIATSMDSTKSEDVHHSFVEIIKQLSPIDAMHLYKFKETASFPIVRYVTNKVSNHSQSPIEPLVFFPEIAVTSLFENRAVSASNLVRLGLLSISFDTWMLNPNVYEKYETGDWFNTLRDSFTSKTEEFATEKGILTLTPFGNSFIRVCL